MAEARRPGDRGRGMMEEIFGNIPLPAEARPFNADYEEYWRNRISGDVITEPARRRARGILPFLTPGDTVLDIGCGTGETLECLGESCAIFGTGLDVSETALERVAAKGFATMNLDLTAEKALLPSVYDQIVLFEVIEHTVDAESLLLKLKNRYRKGLYITTPNLGYIAHRLRMLHGRFPVTYISDPREHVRYWSTKDFRAWMNWLGYPEPEIRGLRGKSMFLARKWPSMWASEVLYRFDPPSHSTNS